MRQKRRAVVVAAVAASGVGLAFVINIVTGGSLPHSLEPYRGYSWFALGVFAVVVVGGAVWQSAGQRRPLRRRGAAVTAKDRDRAVANVRAYVRERLNQSLGQVVRVPLGLEFLAEAVTPPRDWYVDRARNTAQVPATSRLCDVFRDLDESMLVLGEPGAGKTTLLLELADELLGEAGPPLAVLVELARWAPPADDDRGMPMRRPIPTDLHDWLLARVQERYGIGTEVARTWLRQSQLVLLLDGLDEVPQYARAACATLIDRLRDTYPRLRLAVSCRRQEYEALPTRLELRGALVIQPLSDEQIEAFLADPALADLRTAVRKDPALRELLTAPLWLQVLLVASRTEGWQRPTSTDDLRARRRELLDTYIGQALNSPRATNRAYGPDQSKRWLAAIARTLRRYGRTTISPRGRIKGNNVSALPYAESQLSAWIVAPTAATLGCLPMLWLLLRQFGIWGGLAGALVAVIPAYLTGWIVGLLYMRPPRFVDWRDRLRAWGLILLVILFAAIPLAAVPVVKTGLTELPTVIRQLVLAIAIVVPLVGGIFFAFRDNPVELMILLILLVAGGSAVWLFGRTPPGTTAFAISFLGTVSWFWIVVLFLTSLKRANAAVGPIASPLALRAGIAALVGLLIVALTGLAHGGPSAAALTMIVPAGAAGTLWSMIMGRLVPTRLFDRWLLVYFGVLPIRLRPFLRCAVDLGLLQRGVEGYRFPHPLIEQRFAEM